MPAIEARALSKVYRVYRKEAGLLGAFKGLARRRYDEVHAAKEVSFSIEEGEFVGFLGPNGAGKTTVLKMLSGLLHPSAGEARVLGYTPWERQNEFKRQFALLLGQKNSLWWDIPARESLELNRAIYGIEPKVFKEMVGGLAELLEVNDKLDIMVRELSLGERMKMELIAALLHGPRVLLLDEPTIGLDVGSAQKVREFLRSYHAGRPMVTMLTSHYMQDIEALCRRVIIIDHGQIFFDGALSDVVDRFSQHKVVHFSFDTAGGPVVDDFSRYGEVTGQEAQGVYLKVPRQQVASVCRAVLAQHPVLDINVEEIPVEEVIRQMFLSRGVDSPA